MEKKIIEILLKHSSELKMKGEIMAEPEIEDWLWSGEFEKVAQEIVKLFAIPDVSNWLAFDEIKPKADKLFLITNGSFVEIAYYEDGEIMKPWRYDKHDTATLTAQQNGLKWQYINLPACC